MAESKRLVKVSVFYSKKADVSDEEFHKFWSETHGPTFCSLPICQQKVLKYNQYHSEPTWKSKAASMGLPVIEFDGVAEVWFEDIESLGSLLRDPGYTEKVLPDMNKIVNKEASKFMFGYDVVQMDRT